MGGRSTSWSKPELLTDGLGVSMKQLYWTVVLLIILGLFLVSPNCFHHMTIGFLCLFHLISFVYIHNADIQYASSTSRHPSFVRGNAILRHRECVRGLPVLGHQPWFVCQRTGCYLGHRSVGLSHPCFLHGRHVWISSTIVGAYSCAVRGWFGGKDAVGHWASKVKLLVDNTSFKLFSLTMLQCLWH